MEEKLNVIHDKNHGTCGCCTGGMMGIGSMHGRHYLAKRLFMLALLMVVFWFGTKLGELRTLMRYTHAGGYGTMMRFDDDFGMTKGMMTSAKVMSVPAAPAGPTQ